MRSLLCALVALSFLALGCSAAAATEPVGVAPQAAGACYSCGSWVTWGHRLSVCASPSEGLVDDLQACIRRPDGDPSGGCATTCASYIASYDACEASGVASCVPGGIPACGSTPSPCEECIASTAGGCGTPAAACSADVTECVSCGSWLAGANPYLVCSAGIDPLVAVAECACAGACANKCGGVCSKPCGWELDTVALNKPAASACKKCVLDASAKGCGAAASACQ